MNNKNSGRKCMNCYEDEYGSMTNNNYNFDFDIDMDEEDECFTEEDFMNDMANTCSEDMVKIYKEGFKAGYEKARQEVLVYMKKNKCCIKCKHHCKRRRTNKNKKCHKMIKCIR